MEECYRRRARRAGLEDTLPVGRPMTEEEIEDLQWQLGDFGPASGYGSRGKKRSQQEVIDMTIEEMEAEIQETNEAIRNRRRRGLGLMLKPLWMLTVLACFTGSPAAAFYCIRLLQSEQCGGVILAPGTRRVRQHGKRRRGGDDCLWGDCPN
jgi:hypothetical protein